MMFMEFGAETIGEQLGSRESQAEEALDGFANWLQLNVELRGWVVDLSRYNHHPKSSKFDVRVYRSSMYRCPFQCQG